MNCRNCKAPMLGKDLLCKQCITALSLKSILKRQPDYLPAAISGALSFRIARRYGKHDWHVELLGGFHGQAFCGVLFEKEGKRQVWEKKPRSFQLLRVMEDLCADCEKAITASINAIKPEAA